MATLQSIIDSAIFIAGVDNTDVVAESLVQIVFQSVSVSCYQDPNKQSLLRRTHTIALTNGVGVVPESVFTSALNSASFNDPADPTIGPIVSYVAQWSDFVGPLDTRLGYWTCKGDSDFHYTEPETEYDPASGFTGDIELTVPSIVEKPSAAGSTVVARDEIISDLIEALAKAIRLAALKPTKAAA